MGDSAGEAGGAAGPVIAAIDIGSNSIKWTAARLRAGGGLEWLGGGTETVRLGSGVEQTGRLAEDRIAAALAALRRFAGQARALGAARIVAVATEATRRAANGPGFLARVRQETGIEARAISGEEEAALNFRGLAALTDLTGRVVVADIGGGSTELIVATDGAIERAQSLRLGSGTLTERHLASDPPTAAEIAAATAAAGEILAQAPLPSPEDGPAPRLIVVGGTGEHLGRLAGELLTSAALDAVIARLQAAPAAAFAAELGIPEARARVLPGGAAIVRALVERLRPEAIVTAPSGIRAGLLLEAFTAAEE